MIIGTMQCDGCLGVYPDKPIGVFIKGLCFQISRTEWKTFSLCKLCDQAITDEAKAKVVGKKISNAQANVAIGQIAYAFCGERKGRTLGHNEVSTWDVVEQKSSANTRGAKMSLILFKDGDRMGIQTDCATEFDFVAEFGKALSKLIDKKEFEGDWEFQFAVWLPQFADMVCAYRGYKSNDVRKSVVMSVGNTDPQTAAYKALAGENNKPVLEGFLKHVNGKDKELPEEFMK